MTEGSLPIKNSTGSPIRVDFVPGRPLGLTFAPGKQGPALMGRYVWERDLEMDLERLSDYYGTGCLVTLVEAHELEELGIARLRERVRAHDMTSHWFPIPDGGVPDDVGAFIATVRTIVSSMLTGVRVVVHCRGGLGRAGLVAACVLVAMGERPDEAIAVVRGARPRAIENEAQEDFVLRFPVVWSRAAARNNSNT